MTKNEPFICAVWASHWYRVRARHEGHVPGHVTGPADVGHLVHAGALQVVVVEVAEIVNEDRVLTLRKGRDVIAVRELQVDGEAGAGGPDQVGSPLDGGGRIDQPVAEVVVRHVVDARRTACRSPR